MRVWLTLIFLCLLSANVFAQKPATPIIDIDIWANHAVDSLQKINVDTIEYYHQYCGECEILRYPNDTTQKHFCIVETSWMQMENIIIYKQKDKYYSLTFDCGYPQSKRT